MQAKTLDDIDKMNGLEVMRALDSRLIKVNDIDKAVLVLDKLQTLGMTKPKIAAECKHLEHFIQHHKF